MKMYWIYEFDIYYRVVIMKYDNGFLLVNI